MTEAHVADYLALNPNTPLYWPIPTIRRLMRLMEDRGHEAFQSEIWRMMYPR